MNYDTFEREVLGYAQRMQDRTERMRVQRSANQADAAGAERPDRGAPPMRLQFAAVLRGVAARGRA